MDVTDSVVPIFFKHDSSSRVNQIGTGVFVDFLSEPCLFTAAHVTDDSGNGCLMVPTAIGIIEIDGYLQHIDLPPDVSRKDDLVDIACYRLSTDFALLLRSEFPPLIRRAEPVTSSLDLGMLSVVGFPASKAKARGNEHSSELALYRGIAAGEEEYVKFNLSTDVNIVFHFHRKRAVSPLSRERINMISPRGASGGAIFSWPVGSELSNDWSKPRLVGIMHSYKKREGLFVGTTLAPFYAAITLGKMKGFGGVV